MLKRKLPLVLIFTLLISLLFTSCSDSSRTDDQGHLLGYISPDTYYFFCRSEYLDLYNGYRVKYPPEKMIMLYLFRTD